MAQFSNNSEGMCFDEECFECPLKDEACPIALVQQVYNYDQISNETVKKILDILVVQKDGEYIGCAMKKILDKLKEAGHGQ